MAGCSSFLGNGAIAHLLILGRMKAKSGSSNGAPSTPAHETRWAAATGLWEFNGDSATYTGPSSSEGFQPYGLALTNWSVTDGTVSVHVKFSALGRDEERKGHISAGLVLGFQSERSRYILVQLGAYGSAYSIAEYRPGAAWQGIENVGSARNLELHKEYQIDVRQTGQEIRMVVDGVPVIERLLGEPLAGN